MVPLPSPPAPLRPLSSRPPLPSSRPPAAADSKPVADQPEPASDASAKKDVDGLKVLVLCAGAGTSAMLANAIKEGAAQTGENIASSAGAYGQHTAIMDQYDVIVLAPQVRSYYNDMKADTDRLGIKLLAPRGKEYIDLTRDPAGAHQVAPREPRLGSSLCWCPDPQFGHLSLFESHRKDDS